MNPLKAYRRGKPKLPRLSFPILKEDVARAARKRGLELRCDRVGDIRIYSVTDASGVRITLTSVRKGNRPDWRALLRQVERMEVTNG